MLACIACCVCVPVVFGQSEYGDPYRFWKWPVDDARALLAASASRSVILAAGGGGLLLLAARHDPHLTEELSGISPPPRNLVVIVVEELGNAKAVRPVAGLLFLGSLMTDDRRLQDAAFTSLESIVFANLMTNSLKSAFGRARPWQERGALEFRPFSGNTSFPSGHSTTAFAAVTPWLLYYPNMLTPGLIILSSGTAFSRMLTLNHWFTDVVAGSAIGFATAYFLTRRHQDMSRRVLLAPTLTTESAGLTVSIRIE